ncbi:hypothetical protein AB4559_10205 [Vibrio sp. 10N.222.51.C8]|uniref:hypothetical protein n=1 Tax=Vibrio TaxID=662 RepID=UPI0002ED58DF|nr:MULTISPECIES: hypothetical protein [Vibrio]ANP74928.1 hypothetical protein A134_00135 [Vibrio crassostreae 9CS106]OEE88381.1 hypothetical protein A140_06815 [Vibrio crassostreae 9ZC88]OEF08661.1 hypothetical protein A138_08975 [Vibrio crassostreae 9ZC77]PMK09635.1 hypothetical protein BCU07_15165 [Vibrio sp. 10N.261.54.E10]PMK22218.1 hypothetical protein BCU05_01585 [Vibrio sp. 10N.261.54.C3]
MEQVNKESFLKLLSIYNQREKRYQQRLDDFKAMRDKLEEVEEPRVKKNELYIKLAIAAAIILVIAFIFI